MSEQEIQTIGTRIRAARGYRRISQVDLAKRIGLSKTALSQIETGVTEDPRSSVVLNVARVLGVNGNYLLGLSERIEPEKDLKTAEAA
jgi:transcriptional regulator with XRE-family HTH domain